eukprot:Gb_32957 [translate_table: standard]
MESWEASISSWDGDCRSGSRRAGAVHMSSGSRRKARIWLQGEVLSWRLPSLNKTVICLCSLTVSGAEVLDIGLVGDDEPGMRAMVR